MMNYKRLNFTKLAASIALTILLVGVGFCFGESANAQEEIEQPSNLRILYQGSLFGPTGNPITDGKYNMRFRIYDGETQGNILWQEEYTFYNTISVKEGQFKIILGRENPIELNLDDAPFWLGISIGLTAPEGISWEEEIQPREKITTLSEFLGTEELTPEQWENLSQLIQEKLGDETEVVLLFDIAQLENLEIGQEIDFSSSIISFFQNFINFIDEKISEIGEKINQILVKIDSIIDSLANIVNTLAEMKHKIDVLYDVLIVQQGLEPAPQVETCDFLHLNLCLNEKDCIYAGGFWHDGICNAEARKESTPSVAFLNTPYPGKVDEEIAFSVAISNFATDTLTFNWDFGDENSTTTNQPTATHIYKSAGTFTVFLIVTDGTNQADTSTAVEITANLPLDGDGDGIPDSQDACPKIFGDYCYGCPEPGCDGCQSSFCPETGQPICQDDNLLCAAPDAIGVCKNGICTFTCEEGYQNSDEDWSNGCETPNP